MSFTGYSASKVTDDATPRSVLLAIDVGNTRTHFGVFSGHRLILDWYSATNDHATADDLAAEIARVVVREGLVVRAVGIASSFLW